MASMHRYAAALAMLALATGCKRDACDSAALEAMVASISNKRSEKPAWFGDPTGGSISGPLFVEEFTKACPGLPADLKHRLEIHASMWEERAPLIKTPPRLAKKFRKRRDELCKDPSVFEELGQLPADKRAGELQRRCALGEEYQPNQPMGQAFGRAGWLAPALRHHLVDTGVEQGLATKTVELMAFPDPRQQVQSTLAHGRKDGEHAPEGALVVRATETELVFPDGPTVPFEDGGVLDPKVLQAWVDAQIPGGPGDDPLTIAMDFDATRSAAAVSTLLSGRPDEGWTVWALLYEGPDGWIRAEHLEPIRSKPTHAFTTEGGRYVLRAAGEETEALAAGDIRAGFESIGEWASGQRGKPQVVHVHARGLTVQQLIDVVAALRGPDCPMLGYHRGESPPESCYVKDIAIG